MTKLAFVVSTVVAVVIGLDTVGGRPIAPGTETRFMVSRAAGPGMAWELLADRGNLTCCLELEFGLPGRQTGPVAASARIVPDVELGAKCEAGEDGSIRLRVVPLAQSSADEMFSWPAGRKIEVRLDGPASIGYRLTDWTLFLSDEESDSRSKARWRRCWFWVSLISLIISLPTAIVTGWPRARREHADPAYQCVVDIIDGIEGADDLDTKRIRTMLRKVCLEGASLSEAFDAAKVKGIVARLRVWRQARERFMSRLNALIAALVLKARGLQAE